jgi:hypothetical protein
MTVLSSATADAIAAQIVECETLLAAAMLSYAEGVASSKKSYKFDSTEGMQAVVKHSLKDQRDNIEWLEKTIAYLQRRLAGGLNVNLNVRRKQGVGLRRRGYPW